MKQLSSGSLLSSGYLQAWVGLALLLVVGVFQGIRGHVDQAFAAFAFAAVVILGSYVGGVFGIADRVVDAGTHLLVHRRGRVIELPLRDVADFQVHSNRNSTRLKLLLVGNKALGESLEFVVDPDQAHAIAGDLLERARDARVPPR